MMITKSSILNKSVIPAIVLNLYMTKTLRTIKQPEIGVL